MKNVSSYLALNLLLSQNAAHNGQGKPLCYVLVPTYNLYLDTMVVLGHSCML